MIEFFSSVMRVVRRWISLLQARVVYLGLIPLLLLIGGFKSLAPEREEAGSGQERALAVPQHFRTVVMILDSVGTSMAFDPSLMPFIQSMTASSLYGRARACPAKATFPCVKTIFEGRIATTGTTLQDFSAVASRRTTWPWSLAAMGLRVAVASDHTLNRLYPGAYAAQINYEDLSGPLLERDEPIFEQSRRWLNDPRMDVLILHIIGTDAVSHHFSVGGPEYRAKFLEVDNFVREIAGRLQEQDYLYLIGDHGHNSIGGHDENAMYLAHGPLFPHGRHENLTAEDMLFLLSVPYGLTLPAGYEGSIRTDLTLLAPDRREEWLRAQADMWRVNVNANDRRTLESRLNERTTVQRTANRRKESVSQILRIAPWWIAAALFLIGELPSGGRRLLSDRTLRWGLAALVVFGISVLALGRAEGAWAFSIAALLRCLDRFRPSAMIAAIFLLSAIIFVAFYGTPELNWMQFDKKRPLRSEIFYGSALIVSAVIARKRDALSWRRFGERVLWLVSVALWLLAYFGLWPHSLLRQGPMYILYGTAIIAVIIGGGLRPLFSLGTIYLFLLVPFLRFRTVSLNISYPWFTQVSRLPAIAQIGFCILAGLLLIDMTLRGRNRRSRWRKAAWAGILFALWLFIGHAFFQFEWAKLFGCLLASLCLAGCFELFSRANLPARWFALVAALVLLVILSFVLDGLSLSHVDFRFAMDKIIPFQREALRAPQLIGWAIAKYLFVLLPPLVVTRRSEMSGPLSAALLWLNWSRLLIIVLAALGLAIFDTRGMHELCAEEIYFWTFLSLVAWWNCLSMATRERAPVPVHPPEAMW